MSTSGLIGLGAAVVVALLLGLVLRRRDGRLRATAGTSGGWALAERDPAADDRVLLLQLSSPICTPCRQTAAVLGGWESDRDGVVHVEIDVADRPDVARELGVMRTPTVVAFDRAGAEVLRVSGVPKVSELETALAAALADDGRS